MLVEYCLIIKLRTSRFRFKKPARWSVGNRNPVIVIPGFHETFWFLRKLIEYFNSKGYPIHTLPYFESTDKVASLSKKVGDYIKEKNLQNVILLAHSKGGLVAKHLLANDTLASSKIYRVVAIAAPFNGNLFGYLYFDNLNELLPNSTLITGLQGNTLVDQKIISLYPLFDNHVLPNSSSILAGAVNIQIPVIGHTVILESSKTCEALDRYF